MVDASDLKSAICGFESRPRYFWFRGGMAYALVLGTSLCGFESHRNHQFV